LEAWTGHIAGRFVPCCCEVWQSGFSSALIVQEKAVIIGEMVSVGLGILARPSEDG
jgi:hypothetical protein